MTSGLELFGKNLHPEVIADIRGWAKHPELSKLLKKLRSIKDWSQFLDHYAEAMVAWHLIRQGSEIEGYEVPTVNGRNTDLEVSRGGDTFFVHVKRLDFDKEMRHDLNVSKRLVSLQKRGVGYILHKSLTDEEMQNFYKEAKKFSKKAKVGETKIIVSKFGEMLGECDKVKNGQPTSSAYSPKNVDDSDRFSDKLSDAYKQFMPDAVNLILITSAWRDDESVEDLREALEKFWANSKHPFSNIIGWFEFYPRGNKIDFKLFFRETYKRPPYIIDVFGPNYEVMTM